MRDGKEPLLEQKTQRHAQRIWFALCTLLCAIVLLCGRYQRNWNKLETLVGVGLPGCKVLNGRYKYSDDDKVVNLMQAGCRGRDIETGALFTVYGKRITIPQDMQRDPARGTILENGNISWDNGKVWLLVPDPTPNPRKFAPAAPAAPASANPFKAETTEKKKKCTGRNCNCASIGGTYEEIDPNNPDDPNKDTVMYRQFGCKGADLTHGAPFTMKGNKIHLIFGDDNEGEVQEDGRIVWANGFIHVPTAGMLMPREHFRYTGGDKT